MEFSPPAEIFGVDGIIILIVVVLVLFGSTQIPKLARSLGSAQKEFKRGVDHGAAEADAESRTLVETSAAAPVHAPAPVAIVEPESAGSPRVTS